MNGGDLDSTAIKCGQMELKLGVSVYKITFSRKTTFS